MCGDCGCVGSVWMYLFVVAIHVPLTSPQALGGITYLRYDDTNPETEDERYIREIQEMVEWLGKRWEWLGKRWEWLDKRWEWLVRGGSGLVR